MLPLLCELYAGEKRTAMLPHALAVARSKAIKYSSLSLCKMPSVRPHSKRNACRLVLAYVNWLCLSVIMAAIAMPVCMSIAVSTGVGYLSPKVLM